ncbi:TetR/AcrR family transcriptional regulator [Pseudomonas sp.]|uniref:TetR/AcrR family transcriptional regulator n=1 Tax=Pseudomonas sp. TaxID=306 RepID=UPI002ED79077
MRYSADHKEQTRRAVLDSSAALAKENGFAPMGVDGLMKAVGLTGGAFYSHFASKDDLFQAVVERELTRSLALLGGDESLTKEKIKRCVRGYLSLSHVQDPAGGCVIPALGSEIARAEGPARLSAEHWLCELHRAWGEVLGDEDLAWGAIAQCVGALMVARMMATPERQQRVVDASYQLLCQQVDALTAAAKG